MVLLQVNAFRLVKFLEESYKQSPRGQIIAMRQPAWRPGRNLVWISGTPRRLTYKPFIAVQPVEVWEMIRMIATARVTMPTAMVRLSAGRVKFSQPEQVTTLFPFFRNLFRLSFLLSRLARCGIDFLTVSL